jgi:hypothetical protein
LAIFELKAISAIYTVISALLTLCFQRRGQQMNSMFTDRVRRVVQLAHQEAKRLGHKYVGTEHLRLGLINEGDGIAVTVLLNLNLDLEQLAQMVEDAVPPSGGAMVMGDNPFPLMSITRLLRKK